MNNSRDWPLTAPIHTQTCTCTHPHTPCLTHMCMCRYSVKNKSAGWNFSLISNLRWRRIYSYAYVVHQVHFSVAGKSTVSLPHPAPRLWTREHIFFCALQTSQEGRLQQVACFYQSQTQILVFSKTSYNLTHCNHGHEISSTSFVFLRLEANHRLHPPSWRNGGGGCTRDLNTRV